ncbi:uncharacterized protein PADG_12449 [Paracoccidioides brasiliensis Pb18]|uniref:PiggyBac transposable element-derived protein domain-containing protein n=1 Tax=Paracoccidioides brasiliensis (strain Pb18) TaxID=502780 RepID=A0A0A0HVK2_PARBD|nr:uncharacterized protein PADG_12449 [Paracoccidioides brasiliensis Pb18]KGM91465.1 hypothetical protein PADG_12449 [Paracoccidioides brasiliensis Pb18]
MEPYPPANMEPTGNSESVKFLPLEPSSRLSNLHIPPDIDVQSPYALFTLFFSEDSIHNIVNSTNLYAKLKGDDGDTDNEAPESFEKDKEKDKEEEIPMEASAEPSIFMETSKELKTSIQQHPWKKTTSEEIKMPAKPIPQGYKVFGLAEHGYLWTFSWSSRRQGIMPMFQFPGITRTGSMVMNMIQQLPKIPIIRPTEELDTRPSTEESNTRPSTETPIIEASIIKALPTSEAPTRPSAEERPGELSTNAHIVRPVFENQPRKNLQIPKIIDDYNHNMNGVDLSNQYRASYSSHRVSYRTWLPIFYWILDAAVVNAWRLQYIYMKQQGVSRLPTHISFCEKLYQQLFEFNLKIHDDLPHERSNPELIHQRISLPKPTICVWCRYIRKLGQQESIQAPRSRSGCSACKNVALCLKTRCWEEFLGVGRAEESI